MRDRWDEMLVDLDDGGNAYGHVHVMGSRVEIRNDVESHMVEVGWQSLRNAVDLAWLKLKLKAKEKALKTKPPAGPAPHPWENKAWVFAVSEDVRRRTIELQLSDAGYNRDVLDLAAYARRAASRIEELEKGESG